ncbi:MAG: UDP-N-acetylglucosamine 1-carboxyvinyltransferase [Candidatus Kerfeldbacteria bacterium RIFOXYA2_FULL_38_24]|uniref:UDP-N-acetylglucosamine 1-carboxyvinyltransferase n=1 Tax=Candidatus Kerfeldbacteria bacterium RIFOXYB2_FULL_38_14 TaxID=1798547 RepID=A0A1G2BC17_9BACT|nr:MAG: UDP-N-acetylglucosamine 1-carboxyvinyltransferase [Candidatus Kerfeldbacteria bacterium RIFOXYA2_FULL_38_24]OGY85830.1 MAG: UDP-N-acetylglucosamine 1-carboxyvinyltransferase [Candidatus Kerfeldbacteria bacterium RIFOXYB2_FULL_38_14]OGY89407.1 MAG: UDP-N-acetylglucosamine 1-carboxyvinyltransferase [Candidatus Kerfeldbacteria bacterium RIFOXYC2_FULL_38_9]
MEKFIIRGKQPLSGEIPVNGAKNHALKIIPAALLSTQESVFHSVPQVEDVDRLLEIVEDIGGVVKKEGNHTVRIVPPAKFNGILPKKLVPKLRASILLLGSLLVRFGRVEMPHPGGCNLGRRPIDLFIDAFKALGAQVESLADDGYVFQAPHGLQGARYVFPLISVTGTETLMMAATLAHGKTVIVNAAGEPEISALADYLNACGARITGAGTHTIEIEGVQELHGGESTIIPDRIESGSFVILALATNSPLTITHCRPKDLEVPLRILKSIGANFAIAKDAIKIYPITQKLKATNIVTHEYPGFPTDLQAPMTVLLTQALGQSLVRETIYEGRLLYTDVLNAMGANISLLDPYRAMVTGGTSLRGKEVASPDIRAGIALVIAGLTAQGTTTIQNIYQIDRGYEHIEERLQHIGAKIERVNNC